MAWWCPLSLACVLGSPVPLGFSPFQFGFNNPGTQWFRLSQKGLFVHFAPVSQWGAELSWPLYCAKLPCEVQENGTTVRIQTTEQLQQHRLAYEALAKTFNPTQFDPDAMAQMAKDAGFEYVIYTAVHCDGFAAWPSKETSYNIMNTPYGQDLFGNFVAALRRHGLRAGAYVCPSLWNRDDYWAPNHLTALGGACTPNYDPNADPTTWASYLSHLHALVQELITGYKPDLFWFDCYNYLEGGLDTNLEGFLPLMRQANPDVVVLERGGLFTDYSEPDDQSEAQTAEVMGMTQQAALYPFEVCGVSQVDGQWGFNPASAYKNASLYLKNLAQIASRGGNYLYNIGPNPSGVWVPAALAPLQDLIAWNKFHGDAFNKTQPTFPYSYEGMSILAKTDAPVMFIIIPQLVRSTKPGDVIQLPFIRNRVITLSLASVSLASVPLPFTVSPAGLLVTLQNVSVAQLALGPVLRLEFR